MKNVCSEEKGSLQNRTFQSGGIRKKVDHREEDLLRSGFFRKRTDYLEKNSWYIY